MAVALTGALALVTGACESRNPAEVSRQRHPEFYEDAGPVAGEARRPDPIGDEPSREGAETRSETTTSGGLEKLDLTGERRSGRLRIRVNDPVFHPRLDALFDGDTSTLSRTEDVNPLVLLFELDRKVRLRAVRIYPSYSSYDWSLETGPDQKRLVVRDAGEEMWSGIRLEQAVETDEVRLEVRRLLRDDFVHVNEVELWVEPQP
jgi:hypothetical protein